MFTSIFILIAGIALVALLYFFNRRSVSLGLRILISLFFGIGYGFLLQHAPSNYLCEIINNTLRFVGQGYLALLKMLVIPLILTSIIHAIVHFDSQNNALLKKMSLSAAGILLTMTAISSFIGLAVGYYFGVGEGLVTTDVFVPATGNDQSIVDTLLGMIPSNPFAVLAQENTVAIVIFALILAIAARSLEAKDKDKMETFKQLIAALFAIVKKLASLVLSLTPYAVFSLLSLLLLQQGTMIIRGMVNYIEAMYAAMLIVMAMHCLILFFCGHNPLKYLRNAILPLSVAFTTRSSFGSLPVTEETLRTQFKTNPVVSTFVPSLGATIGMNACAGVFPAMLVMMTLTMMGQSLTPYYVVMVMIMNAVASLGVSGIPGTAYVAAMVTLSSLHLPSAIIPIVQGIDPIIDMGRTATNVNGVMTTALVTDKIVKNQLP